MCNGSSARVSQGGTIAILHPTSTLSSVTGKIVFTHSTSGNTIASFEISDARDITGYSVVIHQTGDTRVPTQHAGLLHNFRLVDHGASCANAVEMTVPEYYDFGAGGDGIIGRRVSVFEDSFDREPVVEGVIGWN